MNNPAFADLASLDEDQRIDLIGNFCAQTGQTANVVTDSDEGKPERYIRKLLRRFPNLRVVERFRGPVLGTVTIKLEIDKQHSAN